jgi:hypothetical protein
MKIAVRKLFKTVSEIISISNQPVMHVTMDVSNITQSSIQHTVMKIINTIQFYLVKFHIQSYITTNRQLYHIISINPIFLTVKMSLDFFQIITV